eukprot:s2575_g1.t1
MSQACFHSAGFPHPNQISREEFFCKLCLLTSADLANILNIAAVRSSADNLPCIPTKYLEEAFDRVVV